jgi:lipopolysaccharide/colanic/teichoic acid biosynthesis glycosyltransferase
MSKKLSRTLYLRAKRLMDLVGAVVALVLLFPVFLISAGLIKLGSPGRIFYRQSRIGKDGKPFEILKFRTMHPAADETLELLIRDDPTYRVSWEQYQKLLDDPRLTAFGRIMRRMSIDELPQLWNVLKGEMSLVGPRPFLPEQKDDYGEAYAYYVEMRPGMTGLWQINGRNLISFADRAEWDKYYVRNWSLLLDVLILVRTIAAVLRSTGAY